MPPIEQQLIVTERIFKMKVPTSIAFVLIFGAALAQEETVADLVEEAESDARMLQISNMAGKITDGLAKARAMAGNAAKLFEVVSWF